MGRRISTLAGWIWFALFLFASCGGQTVGLKIVFPDAGAKQAVDTITAWVLVPGANVTCAQLQGGTARPGDAGCPIEDHQSFAWPITGAGPGRLKVDGSGARLFFAEAGLAGAAILRGCTAVADAQGGSAVTITLQWIDSGCTASEDCSVGWYCHDTLHQCLPCSSSNASHCGSACTNCEAQRSDKACIEGVCGCETHADCGTGETCGAGYRCATGADGGMDGDAGGDQGADSSPADSTDGGSGDGCTPICAGKCGGAEDGCGGVCPSPCLSGEYCESGVCRACNEDAHCGTGCVNCSAQATNTACVERFCGCWDDLNCPNTTCDMGAQQ
jgi:hypothetical protein